MTDASPGGFPGMGGWNGNNNFNAMNPFMANPMFNFPQGMSMLRCSSAILFSPCTLIR